MDKNFKFPPMPTGNIEKTEGVPEHLQDSRTPEEMRADYVEEVKRLTKDEGIEVLQNLDINDKNVELSVKMAEIQQEMEKRQIIFKQDSDTGETKKGTNEFTQLQKDTLKETRKELTKTSKYVKGAVIAGVLTIAVYADGVAGGPLQQMVKSAAETFNASESSADDAANITSLITMASTALYALYSTVKSVVQEVKSRKVTNQKVQRIIGMIGLGMDKTLAKNVVGVETKKDTTASLNPLSSRSAQNFGYDVAGKQNPGIANYSIEQKELISQTRTTLDEMGIKRVSREKNQG